MTKMNEINIVFASDNNYAQHATVAMTSVLENMSNPEWARFYLLDDNISASVKKKMKQTICSYQALLFFIPVDEKNFNQLFISGQLSRAAYFRLAMGSLLPSRLEKVIYLDCDLLVIDDIYKLWSYNMNGKTVAAVPDFGVMASRKDWAEKQKNLGIKADDEYFNSGMLVVDLGKWRENECEQYVLTLAAEHNYRHHDQDALNQAFQKDWESIPLRWNVIPPIWHLFFKIVCRRKYRIQAIKARRNMAVLHYAGGYKPWEYNEYPLFNDRYYYYLEKTEFRNVNMPQFDRRRKCRSIRRQLYRIRIADFWQWLFLKLD